MKEIKIKAPAKINLFLDITGTANDGYHTLDTIMQSIDLCDKVTIKKTDTADIKVNCSKGFVPINGKNIAYKAAKAFLDYANITRTGFDIYIEKNIPMQAGLAGGSADAAAVIKGLDTMFDTGFSVEKLCDIGEKIGADVPFCIVGGCMLAQGKGEIFTPQKAIANCFVVVAKPNVGVDTKKAFKIYDDMAEKVVHPDLSEMLKALDSRSLACIGKNMANVFEQTSCLPQVDKINKAFVRNGALGSVMTGTGSAVTGLFADEEKAVLCAEKIAHLSEEVYVTRPV